jgi:hypothetical protein
MSNRPTIRLTIVRVIERQVREGRPEIAVLIVALCSAVTVCTALIASILLAAVIEMTEPYGAAYRECGEATQQGSGARACLDRVLRNSAFYPRKYLRPTTSLELP